MKASPDKTPARPLMAADLCDRCSSGAVVETVMTQGGSLLWVALHFTFVEDAQLRTVAEAAGVGLAPVA